MAAKPHNVVLRLRSSRNDAQRHHFGRPQLCVLVAGLFAQARYESHSVTHSKEARVVFSRAYRQGIGHYTKEQEADEYALEILSSVGIDPRVHGNTHIDMEGIFSGRQNSFAHIEFTQDSCRKLRAMGWRNRLGRVTRPPVGSFLDPHHHGCFRAYNIDQVIMRSGLAVAEYNEIGFDDDEKWRQWLKEIPNPEVFNSGSKNMELTPKIRWIAAPPY